MTGTRTVVDHLMWGAADLDQGMAEACRLFGAQPAVGGAHAGLGTRNALLGLAEGRYLEIIAPDPAQDHHGALARQLATLTRPALITWALRCDNLAEVARGLSDSGLAVRGPVATRRRTPDGQELVWDLLFADGHDAGALFPFFIDWRDCPHPADALTPAGRLEAITLDTPRSERLQQLLQQLDVPCDVRPATNPSMMAIVRTRAGPVSLATLPETAGWRLA